MEGLLEGIAMDISPDGRLLVQDKEGNVLPVMGGKWHGFDTLMRRNEEVDRM
jgi:biotin-(acetyl-CoA carboxylase) ligase